MDQSKLTSEWIQAFNRLGSEGKLKPTVPYHDLFNRKELKGFPLHTLPMWTVTFPTGHITCCDPLVTLPNKPDTYIRTVEPGTYLLETKIIEMEPNEYRYVASRVVFSGNEPVNYELALKGTEDLTDLDDGEFYYHEIIGLDVYEGNTLIGQVKEILQPGANDVWVVKRKGKKDLLLPYIPPVVLDVDVAAGRIEVELMEGLDDED